MVLEMKPIALAVVLAVWFRCGSAPVEDVKMHAVVIVNGTPMLMFTAVYRADAGKQTVVYWVEGGPDTPITLPSCTVRDALNWRCEDKDKRPASGSAMVDGRYSVFGAVDVEGWKFLTDSEWKALQAPPR
jgi:hypothetical protein